MCVLLITYSGVLRPFRRPYDPSLPVITRASYAFRPLPGASLACLFIFFYFPLLFRSLFFRRRLIAWHSRGRRGARRRLINGFVTLSLRRTLLVPVRYRSQPRRRDAISRTFDRKPSCIGKPLKMRVLSYSYTPVAVPITSLREVRQETVSGRVFFVHFFA